MKNGIEYFYAVADGASKRCVHAPGGRTQGPQREHNAAQLFRHWGKGLSSNLAKIGPQRVRRGRIC